MKDHDEHWDSIAAGERSYEEWRAELLSTPEQRAQYEEEREKLALWLQLVEARQAAGLTQAEMARRMGISQAQVARIEKRDYDQYSLTTLRRYVAALGEGYRLEISIRRPSDTTAAQLSIRRSCVTY